MSASDAVARSAQSRRTWRILTGSAIATVGLLAAAPPAAAHKVGVVVVAPPGSTTFEGFRLAVDQSPDVSHPPGSRAGDHLGGVDVDVTLVEARSRPADAGRRAARAVRSGARLVVVLAPPSVASELVPRVRIDGTLIVVAGRRAALPKDRALPVVLLSRRPSRSVNRERLARFEQAFARRHASTPGPAARRGYDAARLLDRILARRGDGPYSDPALSMAVTRAEDTLLSATATVVPAASKREVAGLAADGSPDGSPAVATFAVAGLAVTFVATSLVLLARRKT